VHYFSSAIECESYRAEESRFFADTRGVLGKDAMRSLQAFAATLALGHGVSILLSTVPGTSLLLFTKPTLA
jgi:hypothetical protein